MEQQFVEWLKAKSEAQRKTRAESVAIDIGDDAALVCLGEQRVVVASDSISEGTHFRLDSKTLELIGRKVIAANLSDVAAMGAKPCWATLNLTLPSDFPLESAQRIYNGAERVAEEFGALIIGGDTNTWPGKLVLSATVIGTPFSKPWTIGGASKEDEIFVTGTFGGSILGHHFTFTPRCELVAMLDGKYNINSATDVSDSFTQDLNAILSASKVGATIDLSKLPVSEAAHELEKQAPTKGTALEHALYDGEDFELILTTSAAEAKKLLSDPKFDKLLTHIGTTTSERGLRDIDGNEIRIDGYQH